MLLESITPFNVYLVAKLDSLVSLLGITSFLLFMTAVGTGLAWKMPPSPRTEADSRKLMRWFRGSAVASVLLLTTAVLVPDSRQFAAMVVLPALAESDSVTSFVNSAPGTISKESRELYEMAKAWLKRETSPKNPN